MRHAGALVRIVVNGKPREIGGETDLPSFLRALDINPKLVAVAINGDVIQKRDYEDARVCDGDTVEIVRMVGGGAR